MRLVRDADLTALQEEIRADYRLRSPEDWVLLDRIKKEVDHLLDTNGFWPFGATKFRDQLRHLNPAMQYFSICDAEVMELGSGVFSRHVLPAYFFLNGAKACYSIDPSPLASTADAARALSGFLAEAVMRPDQWFLGQIPHADFLARIATFDTVALASGNIAEACRQVPIHCVTGDPAELAGRCHLDYVFSVAVLEHVFDVDKFFKDMAMLLRPGGVTAHVVDFTDHFFYSGQCAHRWGFLMNGGRDDGTNHLRLSELLRLFEANGFETLQVERHALPVPPEVLENLKLEYRDLSYEDLETHLATIVSRRRTR
jgi:SAM-dependent methyltransferase